MSKARASGVAVAICVAAAGIASAALLRSGAALTAPVAIDAELDIPPLPGDVARPLAFGFRPLLADLTFLQAVQLLAQRHPDMKPELAAAVDHRLQRLLQYTVEVDPKFAGAYRFAAAALPHETMDGKAYGVLAATHLLEKGLRECPEDWHMGFLLGFLQSYYLRDFAAAAHSFAQAAPQEHAPPWVGLLATRLAALGGELEMATSLAEAMLDQATEESTRKEWQERVDALHMERDLREIEAAVGRYRAEHGALPRSVASLAAAGYLQRVPREPHGGRYVIEAAGTVRSTAAPRLRAFGMDAKYEVH